MLTLLWLRGMVTRRRGRLVGVALSIAIAVALVACIGSFLSAAQATMTARTVGSVAVDWQLEAQPGAAPAELLPTVAAHVGVAAARPVAFANTTGLSATTGGTTQTTGPGVIVGIPYGYSQVFPEVIRPLLGSPDGVQVAQQTAANLRVKPGDVITVGRSGFVDAQVLVSGVVDLPQADTLFQNVGAPAAAQPTAPPDNVLLLPARDWHALFDPLAAARPDQVRYQVHVRLDHHLPSSPAAAFDEVGGSARNLETQLAGAGRVGDNIGAALDAARSDAAYATMMFLFLGAPGVALAALLAGVVAGSGAERRRREQGLLRARGATTSTVAVLAAGEALLVALVGVLLGLSAALLIGFTAFGSAGFGAGAAGSAIWAGTAALVGLVTAGLVIALPAWRDARRQTVAAARQSGSRGRLPPWLRLSPALALLGAAIAVYAVTSRRGYQLVLAPEGVPSISVDYFAFLGPACLWLGIVLLAWRGAEAFLLHGRRALTGAIRPLAGGLAGIVAASMSRQHRVLAPAAVMVAVTVAFAASTAVFTSTYAQQAEVDARLTNGADVTAKQAGATPGLGLDEPRLSALAGVQRVEPLLHRVAYVGFDLQDLYGVRAATIVAAARLQNAYFQGGTAADLMRNLSARRDGVLVSAETVKDFQLQVGDRLTLRLQDQRSHQLMPVTFHYIGVVKEFPTAPRDSFLVANAAYVAAASHDVTPSTYLIDTDGASPQSVAATVHHALGPGWQVSDIATARRVVGSSLTAVDLGGITSVELGFAFAFMVVASGLLIALGFAERRRTFGVAVALGAHPRQVAAFLWSEAGFVLLTGLAGGVIAGWFLTQMLVAVLTGVFDPPPETLAIPTVYLGGVLAAAIVAEVVVVLASVRVFSGSPLTVIKEL